LTGWNLAGEFGLACSQPVENAQLPALCSFVGTGLNGYLWRMPQETATDIAEHE